MTVYVIDNEYTFVAKMFVPLLILPAERTEIHSQLNYASQIQIFLRIRLISRWCFIEKRQRYANKIILFCYCSFVQEFASPPADGITLLLETLRGVQLAQSSPPSSGHTGPRVGTRRAALDELGCVECLAACTERCTDAPRLLVQAQPGLLALAVCLTSSLNRSRVLALQVTIVISVPSISLGYC